MKKELLLILTALLGYSIPVHSQESGDTVNHTSTDSTVDVTIEETSQSRHQVGINLKMLYKVHADFDSRIPAGTYDDGFVSTDISGNAGASTWNWGYNSDSQFVDTGVDGIADHIGMSRPQSSQGENDDWHPGFEITYKYLMGELGESHHSDNTAHWGLKGAFAYNRIEIDFNSATATDYFAPLGVPPSAPYTGSFVGPGPLLSDTPTPGLSAPLGTNSFSIEGDLLALNGGVYWDIPFCGHASFTVGAGLTIAYFDSEMEYQSGSSAAGGGAIAREKDSKESTLFGGYVEAGITAVIKENWSAYTAIQYNYLESFDQETTSMDAELSFENSFSLLLGIAYSF